MLKEFDKLYSKKGFTLIEALVGMAIILIAVIGPLSVTMNGIKTITQNKNRIIASYLAEEMVEELRNYRDHFAIACQQSYESEYNNLSLLTVKCGGVDFSGQATQNSSPQDVAWKVFLNRIGLDSSNTLQTFNGINSIDQSSFAFTNNVPDILSSNTKNSCSTLYLNKNNYLCTKGVDGVNTVFNRSVILTKISNNAIKVEVKVVYTNSQIFGVSSKSVNVIDYIYAR